MKTSIERRLTKKIALLSLLAALPLGASAAIVASGDTVNWATLQRSFTKFISNDALAQVDYDCTGKWGNDPNCNLAVTDCDCSDSDCDSN